jgi:hypothetical protein
MPVADIVSTEVAPSLVMPRAVVPEHAEWSPSTPDFSSGEALPVSVPVVVPAPARPTPDVQGLPTATRAVPPSVDTVVGVVRGEAPPDVVQRQTAAQPLPVLDSPTPNGGGPDFRPPPGSRPPRVAQVKERRTVVTESRGVPPMHADRVDFPFLASPLRAEVEVAGGIVVAAQRPRQNPVEPMVLVDLAVATARPVRDQPVAIDQRETPRSVARHVQLPGNSVQAARSTQPVHPETAHAAVPTTGPIDIARIVDLVHNRFVRRLAVEAERRGVR